MDEEPGVDQPESGSAADAAPVAEGPSDIPVYNIGAVVQMTGIPAATLRAWERRYGFPDSSRTPGGHRLYSDAQVLRLRWVKQRVDEGLQPSQAVRALKLQEESEGEALLVGTEPTGALGVQGPASLDAIREQLTEALVSHDLARSNRVMQEAIASADPETLMLEVVGPVLGELGTLWWAGKISVATEHLASNLLRQRLLMWMLTAPLPRPGPPVVLACAPDELHEGGLLILAAILRRRRHNVAYLGQSVPLPDLADITGAMDPAVIVLTAARAETAEGIAAWPDYLPDVAGSGAPVVAFGGFVFTEQPAWRERVPGVFLGPTLAHAIAAIERLMPRAGAKASHR